MAEARAAGNPILAVFNTLDVVPNGTADPDASLSGFGYGLANQVFQQIVETVAMSSSSSIVAGQSLSGEHWRLSFTGDVRAFTGDVGDDVGSRMRSDNMADDTADYMVGEREDKECLGSVAQTKSTATAEPIAIVGYQSMAAQCGDNDAIWRAIVDGQDYISPLADDRLSPTAFLRPGSPAKLSTYSAQGASMIDTGALDQRLPYPVMPAKRMRRGSGSKAGSNLCHGCFSRDIASPTQCRCGWLQFITQSGARTRHAGFLGASASM
ncbi:beta-ketoacyl synthase N-terminal-like domain-containing protein [Vibrio sp. PP-XX7]